MIYGAHPEGIFVGRAELKGEDGTSVGKDNNGWMLYRENTLVIRGDSLFLKEAFICYIKGIRYEIAATPTTVSTFAGRIGEDSTVFLQAITCETCKRELKQNPETGVYEEVLGGKTVVIRFKDDMVYIDDMVYMKRG